MSVELNYCFQLVTFFLVPSICGLATLVGFFALPLAAFSLALSLLSFSSQEFTLGFGLRFSPPDGVLSLLVPPVADSFRSFDTSRSL